MSQYKQTNGPRGRKLYFKDGKMVSVKTIPEDILATLGEESVDDQAPEFRKCIFCGQHATEQRLYNFKGVDLCQEHYYDKTMGEIAYKVKEIYG